MVKRVVCDIHNRNVISSSSTSNTIEVASETVAQKRSKKSKSSSSGRGKNTAVPDKTTVTDTRTLLLTRDYTGDLSEDDAYHLQGMYVYMYVCMYVCEYVYVYICMYVCMCILCILKCI